MLTVKDVNVELGISFIWDLALYGTQQAHMSLTW